MGPRNMSGTLRGQALRFATVGVLITLLHIAVAFAVIAALGGYPAVGNGVAFVGATLTSYVLNTRWSFAVPLSGESFRRFLTVGVVGLSLSVAISWGAQAMGLSYWAGIAGVVCVVTPVTFLLHRLWTYRLTLELDHSWREVLPR